MGLMRRQVRSEMSSQLLGSRPGVPGVVMRMQCGAGGTGRMKGWVALWRLRRREGGMGRGGRV